MKKWLAKVSQEAMVAILRGRVNPEEIRNYQFSAEVVPLFDGGNGFAEINVLRHDGGDFTDWGKLPDPHGFGGFDLIDLGEVDEITCTTCRGTSYTAVWSKGLDRWIVYAEKEGDEMPSWFGSNMEVYPIG